MKSIDLKTSQVIDLPPFKKCRSGFGAQLLNDSIYIFGGVREKTVERYKLHMIGMLLLYLIVILD